MISGASYASPGSTKASFAYVWYVTSYYYFCSALVALKALKQFHQSNPFPYKVDFVLVFSEEDMESPNSADKLKTWADMGGKTKNAKYTTPGPLSQFRLFPGLFSNLVISSTEIS